MKRTLIGFFGSLALSACAGAALAGGSNSDGPAAVEAREAAFYQAFLDSDVQAFDDIFSTDFAYQHGSGITFTEAEFIDLIGSGAAVVTRADTPDMTFRDLGATVVTFGQGYVEGRLEDTPFSGILRFVNVWHQSGTGHWELRHRNSEFLPR